MEKFHQLRSEKVITTFGIQSKKKCQTLETLLSGNDSPLSALEMGILDMALDRYEQLGDGWNEEELKMHFISPIFSVANPNIPNVCKTFFERPLSGIVSNYELNVVTDCMIASYNEAGLPVTPYFFLQEFKQSQRFGKTDPQGQMLVAMLLSQQINQNERPLYGCYVIERNWFFTSLLDNQYCVSQQYNSTKKDELLQIIFILRKLKELILAPLPPQRRTVRGGKLGRD